MMKMMIQGFLCLFFLASGIVSAAETVQREGKNYSLECGKDFKFSIRQPDGSRFPFLSKISFDATDKEWKPFFRSTTLRAQAVPEGIRLNWNFSGPEAAAVSIEGILEPHPEWIRLRLKGHYQGDPGKLHYRRIIFGYPGSDILLLGMNAESGEEAGRPGLKAELNPHVQIFHNRKQNNSTASLPWRKEGEHAVFELDIAMIPYVGKTPVFRYLSQEPYEAQLIFNRYCNVLFHDDKPEAELRLLNRSTEEIKGTAELEIRDHRGNLIESRKIAVQAEPGKISSQPLPLPGGRFGYFETRFRLNGLESSRSYCILPPTERKYKEGSIFGGIIYPWNRKTVEKLDLMEWIGMSMIRRAYPIVKAGVSLPEKPADGVYTPEQAELMLHEQKIRRIEPVPRVDESWTMPAGTFRLTEAANEVNARRLPADFAEEMKIEYVKTKLHDPKLQYGSSGTAGVDIHWLEEMQESGVWDYFDALFVHLHCFPRAPEVNNTMTEQFWLHDRVTLLRELMDKYGDKPVYDSENGYLTRYPDRRVEKYPLRSVSESNIAAAFLVRSYLQSLAYGLSNKMWFTIDSYGGFGITEYEQPLPSYPAYAAMTRILDGAVYAGELLSPGRVSSVMDKDAEFARSWFGLATPGLEKELLTADRDSAKAERNPDLKPYIYIRAFRSPEEKPILACWATLYRQDLVKEEIGTLPWKGQKPGVSLLWNGFPVEQKPEPIPVRFRVGVPEVEVADIMGNRRKVKTEDGFLTLLLDDYPQFVFGAAPALLTEAASFNLNLFPKEFQPNAKWRTLVQGILPAEQKHPARKSVFDKPNLSATLEAGKPYPVHVRLTNLGKETEKGVIRLKLPTKWKCAPESIRFESAPGTEKEVVATFQVTPDKPVAKAKITSLVKSERLGTIADSTMNVTVK